MRIVGAILLAIVLVAVVETRPPREKRGMKICSARDVKFMATFVCNLHKRSVRSVVDTEFEGGLQDTDGLPTFGGAGHLPRRTICNGEDCGPQIETEDLNSPNQLNYIQAWLAENGYSPMITSGYRNVPAISTENRQRIYETKEAGRSDLLKILENLGVARPSFAKRYQEIDWPLVPSMTLGDIRKNCCIRQCRVEDFYGACS